MPSLSRELVFLIQQFLDEEKFKDTVHNPSSRQKSKSSVAGLPLTGYLEFGITKGGGKYGNEGLSFGNGEVVDSDKAVVAADDARCSKTRVSILGQGGHAVDAAVATALCLGVVNAMASGIGGGGFMVVRCSATSRTEAINMRETAPIASCHLEMGGHAVDAAVATALCLGVVNAMASGIGGGGFMVVRSSATSRTKAINMRETAPIASSQVYSLYSNARAAKYGLRDMEIAFYIFVLL
ncbi:hypothetical protein AgCh_024499 [Apium graveolens]